MKYINARDILPEPLVQVLQHHAAGSYIYVPSDRKKSWGEVSGYRAELDARNQAIVDDHCAGCTVMALAERYALSESAIRKIIRERNR